MPETKRRTSAKPKTATRKSPKTPSRTGPSKHTAKSSRTTTMRTSESQGVANSEHYNKLIKRGMTPKQAAAFARHSGGPKKSGAKSSKGVTKRVVSRGRKK